MHASDIHALEFRLVQKAVTQPAGGPPLSPACEAFARWVTDYTYHLVSTRWEEDYQYPLIPFIDSGRTSAECGKRTVLDFWADFSNRSAHIIWILWYLKRKVLSSFSFFCIFYTSTWSDKRQTCCDCFFSRLEGKSVMLETRSGMFSLSLKESAVFWMVFDWQLQWERSLAPTIHAEGRPRFISSGFIKKNTI